MSRKSKRKEAELREQEKLVVLQQMKAAETAAAQEEEQRRKSRPIAMEEYYNIAYAKERKRLNEMFGRIDFGAIPEEPTTVEKIIYKEPDLSEYVHVSQYKRKKKSVGFLTFTTLLFAAASIVLALMYFGLFKI